MSSNFVLYYLVLCCCFNALICDVTILQQKPSISRTRISPFRISWIKFQIQSFQIRLFHNFTLCVTRITSVHLDPTYPRFTVLQIWRWRIKWRKYSLLIKTIFNYNHKRQKMCCVTIHTPISFTCTETPKEVRYHVLV